MAWVDDRIWCHPKVVPVSDRAFRAMISGIAYSSGFSTGGVLEPAHQRAIGATAKVRAELVRAGLWEERPDGAVCVHDWSEHNGQRDARRAADRERKRVARSAGQGADKPADVRRTESGHPAEFRAENGADVHTLTGEGSEGSEEVQEQVQKPGIEMKEIDPLTRLVAVMDDANPLTLRTLSKLCAGHRFAEGDFEAAREAALGPGVVSRSAVAISELRKRAVA